MKPKPTRYLALLAAVAATMSPALAADPPAGASRDCNKIGDYKEMVACFAAKAGAADTELARVYDTVLHKFHMPLRRDLLAASQAAWHAYRSTYCALVSSAVEGGGLQPVVREACHAELTQLRIKELQYQLTCKEGDVTCVVPSRRP